MLTIHVWPKRLKEFLLTHPLYKSPLNQKLQNRGRDALVASDGRGNYLTQGRRERRGGVWEQSASIPIVLSGSVFPAFYLR